MIDATHEEIVKAMAYGNDRERIKSCMPSVTDADIDEVTDEEVAVKRAYLREMGYIRD